jgi:hypothetical protein
MMEFVLLLASLLSAETATADATPRVEVWAGHEVLNGKRKIPIYGEKETHTENYVLAEVHRTPSRIEIHQKVCRIDVRPLKGVTPVMKPETVMRFPRVHIMLEKKEDGSLGATPWSSSWGAEDIDSDGFPGATVQITGTSCSGDLYVASQSVTTLLGGRLTEDGAAGEISVHLKQKILGAHGFCLKLLAGDSDDTQTGTFSYRRVEPGTSCQSLAGKPWPVRANSVAK